MGYFLTSAFVDFKPFAHPAILHFSSAFGAPLSLRSPNVTQPARVALVVARTVRAGSEVHLLNRAVGVVVSHPLSMREALGSIPRLSTFA